MKSLTEFINNNFIHLGFECKIPKGPKGYGCTVWKGTQYIGGIRGTTRDLNTAVSWAKNIIKQYGNQEITD